MNKPILFSPHNADVNKVPACFTPWQFKMWIEAARQTGGVREGGYCTDCTPEYKEKMHKQSKCSKPEVIFQTDEHGFTEGVLPPCNPAQDLQTLDLFTGQPHTRT